MTGRLIKDLALQRVRKLYALAVDEVKKKNFDRARRYINIALKLLAKANVRKPLFIRRGVCKNCLIPLVPGVTASIRLRGNRKYIIVVKRCLLCGWVNRLPCPRRRK